MEVSETNNPYGGESSHANKLLYVCEFYNMWKAENPACLFTSHVSHILFGFSSFKTMNSALHRTGHFITCITNLKKVLSEIIPMFSGDNTHMHSPSNTVTYTQPNKTIVCQKNWYSYPVIHSHKVTHPDTETKRHSHRNHWNWENHRSVTNILENKHT